MPAWLVPPQRAAILEAESSQLSTKAKALFLLLLTPWGLVWHRLLWQVTSLQPIMMGQSGINVPEGQTEAQ